MEPKEPLQATSSRHPSSPDLEAAGVGIPLQDITGTNLNNNGNNNPEMAPHQYRGRFPSTVSTLSDVGDIGEDHETLVGHDPDIDSDQEHDSDEGAYFSDSDLLSSPSSGETLTQETHAQTLATDSENTTLLSSPGDGAQHLSPIVQETRFNNVTYASSSRASSPVKPPFASSSPTRALSPRNANARTLTITTSPGTPHTPKPQPTATKNDEEKISWLSLPHKSQLTILTLARLSEPITSTSLQSYLYHQISSFDPTAPKSVISTQTGFVLSAFPFAQAFSSLVWGRVADSPRFGRKTVLVVGLLGTAVGTVGYGLAGSWKEAAAWRMVSGALNGNVGVLRTMIGEIVREKKWQSRAFLLMPMCFNIGTIIGPVLGGVLADPVGSYPSLFGPGSWMGGEDGVEWMRRWPYALPNFVSAVFLTAAALGVFLGLEETLESRRHKPDYGILLRRTLTSFLHRLFTHPSSFLPSSSSSSRGAYTSLSTSVPDTPSYPDSAFQSHPSAPPPTANTIKPPRPSATFGPNNRRKSTFRPPKNPNQLPLRKMFTPNVLTTLSSRFLLSLSVGTFQSLWFIFLSTPRATNPPNHPSTSSNNPFLFSGGLGLPPSRVGAAMAILGTIGITLQLFLYPPISAKLGTLNSFRLSLLIFPLVFFLIPFLALLPSTTPAPAPADGPLLWIVLAALLGLHVFARTFALPASIILVNNCSPHPSVLGTVHGVAQSVGSAARFVGPVVGGAVFGAGERTGVVGLAWWILAGVAGVSAVVAGGVREGDGHEVVMEGEVRRGDGEVVYVGDGGEEGQGRMGVREEGRRER